MCFDQTVLRSAGNKGTIYGTEGLESNPSCIITYLQHFYQDTIIGDLTKLKGQTWPNIFLMLFGLILCYGLGPRGLDMFSITHVIDKSSEMWGT